MLKTSIAAKETVTAACRSAPASLLVYMKIVPKDFQNLVFVKTTLDVEVGQRGIGAVETD